MAALRGDPESLPMLRVPSDLEGIIGSVTLPDWRTGLYTTPELPHDLSGQCTLRHLLDTLHDPRMEFHVDDFRDRPQVLSIGLERDGVPETRIAFQRQPERLFFRFLQHPELGLWATADGLTEQLDALFTGSTLIVPS